MSDAEQARKRREKILRNASSRMEAVGGAFGADNAKPPSADPDPIESERKYEQRIYDAYKQKIEGSWIILLISCSVLYGWKYHSLLWPSLRLIAPPAYLPSPAILFLVGLTIKYMALNLKLPAAPPSAFDQILQTMFASLPPGASKGINALMSLHTRAKLLGDVVGDICLGLFMMQVTMLILYLVFEL